MGWHRDGRKAVNRRIRQAAGATSVYRALETLRRLFVHRGDCGGHPGHSGHAVDPSVMECWRMRSGLPPRRRSQTLRARCSSTTRQWQFPSTEQGLKALVEKPAAGPAARQLGRREDTCPGARLIHGVLL